MPPTILHTPGPHESIASKSDSKFEREHAFRSVFRFWSIYSPMGVNIEISSKSMFGTRCSRSNFEKRFGAINSWEPGKGLYRGYIIQIKMQKLFLQSLWNSISFYLNQSMFLENSSTTFWISIQKSIIVSKWALGCISLSPPVPSSIWSPDAPINVAEMVFIFSIEVLYASLSSSSSISLITSFKTLKCHFSHQKDASHFTW